MANATGVFLRGSSYYLCIVLPRTHPLRSCYRNGKYVVSLGACSHRESIIRGTVKRAEVLGHITTSKRADGNHQHEGMHQPLHDFTLRDVYARWKQAKPRSMDSLNATKRALNLYEEFTGNPPIQKLARSQGDGFRAWLQQSSVPPHVLGNFPRVELVFICVDKKSSIDQSSKPVINPATPSGSLSSTSMDQAKTKCLELGFKTGTESFGQCVLKIAK